MSSACLRVRSVCLRCARPEPRAHPLSPTRPRSRDRYPHSPLSESPACRSVRDAWRPLVRYLPSYPNTGTVSYLTWWVAVSGKGARRFRSRRRYKRTKVGNSLRELRPPHPKTQPHIGVAEGVTRGASCLLSELAFPTHFSSRYDVGSFHTTDGASRCAGCSSATCFCSSIAPSKCGRG